VFDDATVARIAARFKRLLEQMARHPTLALAEYEKLSEPGSSLLAEPDQAMPALAPPVDPKPMADAPAAAASGSMPRTAVEIAIAEIWRSLLNLDQIHLSDNFFDLGGHSLLAMRAANEIRKQFGIDPHLHHLIFENLGQVAGGIEQELSRIAAPSDHKKSWWNAVLHRFIP
jgi:hypothetical protein